VAVSLERERSIIRSARIVVSAATEKATRLPAAEAALAGADIDESKLSRAGDAAASEAECISDVRGSAPYKRELVRVFVVRALREALNGTGVPH